MQRVIFLVFPLPFLVATILITEWRNKLRRVMNEMDNAKSAVAVDSLMNFETVSFGSCLFASSYNRKRLPSSCSSAAMRL